MKIIHGKDYYDSANYGIDEEIIFVRNGESKIKNFDNFPFSTSSAISRNKRYIFSRFYVFFCGEAYPALRVMYYKGDYPERSNLGRAYDIREWTEWAFKDYDIFYFYDEEKFEEFIDLIDMDDDGIYYYWSSRSKIKQAASDHFRAKNPKWTQFLIEHGIVTGYYYNKEYYSFNEDGLSDVQFFKVKDAFTANQDISNYVGGILPANANPMVEIGNNDKIVKAGFDTTISFRKRKQG